MDTNKLAPRKWIKDEEPGALHPVDEISREMDRLFDAFFQGVGFLPQLRRSLFTPSLAPTAVGESQPVILRPQMDISSTEKEYTVALELPGVSEKEVRVEVAEGTLRIHGEKKQEKEEKGRNFYRVERSYGSFERTLALPEDADEEGIAASFRNGVVTITIPRKEQVEPKARQIEVKPAS